MTVTYMEWPEEGDPWPEDPNIILFVPMRKWGELGHVPTLETITRQEELEQITYEQAREQAEQQGLIVPPPREELDLRE